MTKDKRQNDKRKLRLYILMKDFNKSGIKAFLQKEINNVFLLDGKVSSKQIFPKIRILFKGFWLMQVEL